MSPEILSIISGFFAFAMFWLLFMDEETDPLIIKRLVETKERKFISKRNDDDLFQQLDSQSQKQKTDLDELLKDSSDYKSSFLESIFRKFGVIKKITALLKLADVKMPVDLFLMIVGGLFLLFLFFALLKGSFFFVIPGFIVAVIPFMVLQFKIKKIVAAFGNNFPDALALISNSLRAGHSLLSSFQMVATDSPYPVNKLFKTVSDDISLGRDIREALEDMNKSIPENDDLKFFITAVLIQKEIGGNLAEILDSLNNTIRERTKLLGLIKTQTSQAELSGIVLGLAPVVIAGIITLVMPSYMETLYTTLMGKLALTIALTMSVMGFLVIKKITAIRV